MQTHSRTRFLFSFAASLLLLFALVSSTTGIVRHPPFARADPTTPIQHIIFVLKENHSFDQMFGLFPGANGATTGKIKLASGATKTIPLNIGQDAPVNYCHLWNCAEKA